MNIVLQAATQPLTPINVITHLMEPNTGPRNQRPYKTTTALRGSQNRKGVFGRHVEFDMPIAPLQDQTCPARPNAPMRCQTHLPSQCQTCLPLQGQTRFAYMAERTFLRSAKRTFLCNATRTFLRRAKSTFLSKGRTCSAKLDVF
jgi:hypothetical protein